MSAVTPAPVRLRPIVANFPFEWDAEMQEIPVLVWFGFLKLIEYDSHLVGSSSHGTSKKRLFGICQLLQPHTSHLHRGFQTDTALTWLWLPLCLLQCFESVFLIWGGRAAVSGDGWQSWAGVFLTLLHLTRNWQLPWRLFQLPFISPFPSSSFWDFSGCAWLIMQAGMSRRRKKGILVWKSSLENC